MADRTYSFRIVWSNEDNAYLASCPEFPGVVAHGDTPEEAIAEAHVALDLAIEMYEAEGRRLPEAQPLVEHSGQFRLRVPKSLHAQLVQRAEDEGLSLNTYIATVIATEMGQAQGQTRAAMELRAMLNEARSQLEDESPASALRTATRNKTPRAAKTAATISFGLVSVAVNVHSSVGSKTSVRFDTLHKKCRSPLRHQYICPKDGEVVEPSEMVAGYEFAKGQYVVFSADELRALEETPTQMIEIFEFVPLETVDRQYIKKVYYLEPAKGGDRGYRLLADALKETDRAALGQYVARGSQHLVLVRPSDDVLVMEQLHYADEVKPISEVRLPAAEVTPQELKLAKQLIEQTSNDEFEPQKYTDRVREHVREVIRRKIEGKDIGSAEAQQDRGGKIIDLMDALKATLAETKRQERSRERKKVS
jgi:DNA end-binding protein Ku